MALTMETIPKGLVATSAGTPSRLEGSTRVDEGDIAKLWKVYGTNTSIHKDDIGHRLENYFWRVWGNTRLLKSLEGSALASLFTSIVTANSVSSPESALLELKKMALTDGDENNLPSILKKPNSKNNHGSLQKRTRIFVGGLVGKQIRKPSSPLTPVSPPPFAVFSGDAAGDDPAEDMAAGSMASGDAGYRDLGSGDSDSGDLDSEESGEDSDEDSDSGDSVAEHLAVGNTALGNLAPGNLASGNPASEDSSAVAPAAENTAAENTATGNSTTGSKGSRSGHRRATIPQPHQKRQPFFVASMLAKRRPVLPRRKSSKTAAGPSKLSSEVRLDSEDVSAKDSKQVQDAEKEDNPGPEPKSSKTPLAENEAETRVPEQKQAGVDVADQQPQEETTVPDVMANLKHILTQSAIKTSSRAAVPRQAFHCIGTRRYPPGARNMPVKLVDDHFRLRFAQEIQREETMLKEINSLPAEERKAVLWWSISALTGQMLPKKPQTTWVVVSDEEAEREALNASSGIVNSSDHGNEQLVSTATATDHKTSTSTLKNDGALDHSSNMQVDVAPKIEGMSYMSSTRAATRLRAPGQLSVLLRAKQYGRCRGGELFPE